MGSLRGRVQANGLNMSALTMAEQLVLLALRRRLCCPRTSSFMWSTLWLACGIAHAEIAILGMEGLSNALISHTRRALRIHRPGCCTLTSDERTILDLIAAHQVPHTGYAAALTRWLVPSTVATPLRTSAKLLAHALQEKDQILPLRHLHTRATDRVPARAVAGLRHGT